MTKEELKAKLEVLDIETKECLKYLHAMNLCVVVEIKHESKPDDVSYDLHRTYLRNEASAIETFNYYALKKNLTPQTKAVLNYFKQVIKIRDLIDQFDENENLILD